MVESRPRVADQLHRARVPPCLAAELPAARSKGTPASGSKRDRARGPLPFAGSKERAPVPLIGVNRGPNAGRADMMYHRTTTLALVLALAASWSCGGSADGPGERSPETTAGTAGQPGESGGSTTDPCARLPGDCVEICEGGTCSCECTMNPDGTGGAGTGGKPPTGGAQPTGGTAGTTGGSGGGAAGASGAGAGRAGAAGAGGADAGHAGAAGAGEPDCPAAMPNGPCDGPLRTCYYGSGACTCGHPSFPGTWMCITP